MIKGINHVAIAVINLDSAIQFLSENYGAKLLWREKFDDQKLESAFISIGESRFELSASLEKGSVIDKFIESRGEGIHHISLEITHYDPVVKKFKANGLKVVGESETDDFKAAFIHPQGNLGVLVEITQPK
jgi:methylmalonyl-CoA/ethylmalonyl-CoA epimerase